MHGGDWIAEVLKAHGVAHVFTLCGGHISPVLVGCNERSIRVIDVRHEATAVFAADAVGRLSGTPGVAVVTAGPGATNTITAVKNACLAQSPVVLLVGAAATFLQGRGALQDIDQRALLRPHVKHMFAARRLRDLVPSVEAAFRIARQRVPGPVAVECPVDLLYPEAVVRAWCQRRSAPPNLAARVADAYLAFRLNAIFRGSDQIHVTSPQEVVIAKPHPAKVGRAARLLQDARRPLLLIGSQALLDPSRTHHVARAAARLNVPVYLSGMARGVLGKDHELLLRHQRRHALKECDLLMLVGVPCDFRLDYGRPINPSARIIAVNRSSREARRNLRPYLTVDGDPGRFLEMLAEYGSGAHSRSSDWLEALRQRDEERQQQINRMADDRADKINPLDLCRHIDTYVADNSVVVADGGDFVATASYTVRARGPLCWMDPGVYGTLGVGAGFALGAKLCRPDAQVWILFGDGSAGYSLTEYDTFVRHGIAVIGVVGNDACWTQIVRDQVRLLGDDVACRLEYTDYHAVAEALGGKGFLIKRPAQVATTLEDARQCAERGNPVLVNAHLAKSSFREGSLSM